MCFCYLIGRKKKQEKRGKKKNDQEKIRKRFRSKKEDEWEEMKGGVEELVEGKIKLNEGNKIKMREEFRKVENRGK